MAFKFEELNVWKESVKFASEIYALTKKFSKNEQFCIISQLNRAVISISSNIAEGCGRNSDADLSRFIQIAVGSLNEVVSLLYISLGQEYINQPEFNLLYSKCEQISKMLYAFRNSLKHRPSTYRPSTIVHRP